MAIDKKLIHFKTWNKFIEQIGSEANITTPTSGKEEDGTALYGQIKGTSIVFIKDVGKIWTHGNLYGENEIVIDDVLSDTSENPVKGNVIKEYVDLHPQYESVDEIDVPEINLPMVECDSELSTTSIKPVYNRVITQALDNKVDKVSGKQLSTEDFTTSLKNKLVGLKEFDPTEIHNEIDVLTQQVNTKQNTLVSGANIKTVNGQSILGSGNIVTPTTTVDASLSTSSTNPVQNKVINTALNKKQDTLTSGTNIKTINGTSILGSGNINVAPEITVDSTLSSTSTNPIQNKVVSVALDNKIDKVTGKGLSTEDFTTALKTKLEGLTNYDDAAIQNAVSGLTTQLNTLVNGDASVAIESFNEIITFLNGVEDSESLDSIIASIEQQIAGKQDKLVSGTNIKTLNGESILGEGNIVVNVDTSNLATKDELMEVEEVAAAAFNDLKGIIDNIPSVEVDAELSADSENAIQNKTVTNELNTKVDKVEGKQLSTEDFTTPLKEKLEGLSAFDPTEINNAIEGLQNSFDALVSGNTSAAIESFNEFVAFLSGITDTQTLAGIVASLEQMIAAKQDKINDLDTIRSGAEKGATAIQQVKTINGEEIVGEGNIEINVDTSTLATKEEVTNLINEVIDDEEVLAHSLNELNERVLNIAEELTGDFASKEEFDSALESLSQADTTNQQAISEVSGKVTTLTERVDNIPAELADDFATKEALETSNSNLTNEVIDDEEVLAHAINDLNARLEALTARIATLESNNA